MSESINKDTINSFLRNPLGLIGLITVVFESIAAIAFTKGLESLHCCYERLPIIWFIVLFPVIVLCVLICLVVKHSGKLYSPMDYGSNEAFLLATSRQRDKKQKEEIKEIEKEEQGKDTKKKKENAISIFMEAESIGLVAASEYFDVQLNKDVKLNAPGTKHLVFDGMAFKGGTLCVAEIKLLTERSWRGVFERALVSMQTNIQELHKIVANVDALLVIVLKGNNTQIWESNLEKEFEARHYPFALKIVNYNVNQSD